MIILMQYLKERIDIAHARQGSPLAKEMLEEAATLAQAIVILAIAEAGKIKE